MRATRLIDAPIITPDLHPSIGDNIQGPSLIRVPDWVNSPLGEYYLYFADHKGSYIRLAYADDLRDVEGVSARQPATRRNSRFLTEPPDAPLEAVEEIMKQREALRGPDNLPHDLLTELTTPTSPPPTYMLILPIRRS